MLVTQWGQRVKTQQKSEVWIPFSYVQFSDLKDLRSYSPPPPPPCQSLWFLLTWCSVIHLFFVSLSDQLWLLISWKIGKQWTGQNHSLWETTETREYQWKPLRLGGTCQKYCNSCIYAKLDPMKFRSYSLVSMPLSSHKMYVDISWKVCYNPYQFDVSL